MKQKSTFPITLMALVQHSIQLFILLLLGLPHSIHGYNIPPKSPLTKQAASSIAKGERRNHERNAISRPTCPKCKRPPVQCVCAALPEHRFETAYTDVLILQHPNEFRRQTFSTVPLLSLVLRNVRVCVGYSFQDGSMGIDLVKNMLDRGRKPLLLYPGKDALELDGDVSISSLLLQGHKDDPEQQQSSAKSSSKNSSEGHDEQRQLLIVVDGTWKQARVMIRESPLLLESCQQIQFTSSAADDDDSRSIYHDIRKEPEPHCLSTLEATAKALLLLEPNSDHLRKAVGHLHECMQLLVDTQIRHANDVNSRHSKRFDKDLRQNELERELVRKSNHQDTNSKNDTMTASAAVVKSPDVDIGNGMKLRTLRHTDAPLVNSKWPYRHKKSLNMITHQINFANGLACLGIEDTKHQSLVAFILRYQNGSLGMLHVNEEYRRCGYGTLLLKEATRAIQDHDKEEEECFAFIVDGNRASEALFTNQGWVRAENDQGGKQKKGTGKRRAKRKWIKTNK